MVISVQLFSVLLPLILLMENVGIKIKIIYKNASLDMYGTENSAVYNLVSVHLKLNGKI